LGRYLQTRGLREPDLFHLFDLSEGVEETEASTRITHTSSKANATTRRLAASDTLAAVRALGIASANAEDANAMISLLERRNDRCASTAWKERTQEHTVGYAELRSTPRCFRARS
jgi:hypothetical protein